MSSVNRNIYLKSLKLKNYCNYENAKFSFIKPNGDPYHYICFYGPNGIGKSSLLEALMLLTQNYNGIPKSRQYLKLRKYITHPDYNPTYQNVGDEKAKQVVNYKEDDTFALGADVLSTEEPQMLIEGTFVLDHKEYIISMNEYGFVQNDLAPIPPEGLDEDTSLKVKCSGPWGHLYRSYLPRLILGLRADNEINLARFQIHRSQAEIFEELVGLITGFKTECHYSASLTPESNEFCNDFSILKNRSNGNEYRIHYKRMSDGERKICQSFSNALNTIHSLSNPKLDTETNMAGFPKILLVDNVEMHVYCKRHTTLIDCLKRAFINQQIFATTHSGVLIQQAEEGKNDTDNELYIDLEPVNS